MANTRSRNYPALSLPDAIERTAKFYQSEGRAKVDGESAVKALGYSSRNGASLRVLSALRQYGLVEGGNDEVRISPTALTLLVEPKDSPDYTQALRDALAGPALFKDIMAEFPEDLPSDPALISYLVRRQGFNEGAAKTLINSFRESMELDLGSGAQYNEKATSVDAPVASPNVDSRKSISNNSLQAHGRPDFFRLTLDLSEDSVLDLRISGARPTFDALDYLTQVLELAKAQIAQRVNKQSADTAEAAQP